SSCWTSAVSATAWCTSGTTPPSRGSRFEPGDDDAGVADRPRLEQAERLRGLRVPEESFAAAEHHRKHHQPELVDEVVVDQRLNQRCAAGDEDVALGLLLQLRHL